MRISRETAQLSTPVQQRGITKIDFLTGELAHLSSSRRSHGIGKHQRNRFERKQRLQVIRVKHAARSRRSDITRLFAGPDVPLTSAGDQA